MKVYIRLLEALSNFTSSKPQTPLKRLAPHFTAFLLPTNKKFIYMSNSAVKFPMRIAVVKSYINL